MQKTIHIAPTLTIDPPCYINMHYLVGLHKQKDQKPKCIGTQCTEMLDCISLQVYVAGQVAIRSWNGERSNLEFYSGHNYSLSIWPCLCKTCTPKVDLFGHILHNHLVVGLMLSLWVQTRTVACTQKFKGSLTLAPVNSLRSKF